MGQRARESGEMEKNERVSEVGGAGTHHIVEAYTPALKEDLA